MTNRAFEVWSDGIDIVYAEYLVNGWVYCQCDAGGPWCKHIESGMKDNTDEAILWPMDTHTDMIPLVIPMFPTQNLYSEISCTKMNQHWLVEWDCPILNNKIELCILNPGEGRNVIRTMLWQHMLSHRNLIKVCEAAHHGYASEVAWKNSKNREAELWCLYTQSMCVTCNKMMAFDDLVPGKSPTAFGKK